MASAVTAAYEKHGVNFKTSVFNIALTGNYTAGGEVVTLTSAASNPAARTITGPNGAPQLPPRVVAYQVGGSPIADGYVANLTPTATAGQYKLTFAQGATLFTGAYSAGDFALIEVDHGLQGY
jgi:hypothetical protein